MSELNQPDERIEVGAPEWWLNHITARLERDPTKVPDMRWIKRDGGYRLEVLYYNVWHEVPLWIENKEEKG